MEFEEEDIKKYIFNMNKVIKSGNSKYISYVSKEYIRLSNKNPMLAKALEGIIHTQAKKPGSIYAIFMDNDGSINLESMSNISKVSNVAELMKNVDALSEQHVDFGDITSSELIIEGMEIAEELAREVEMVENGFDYESEDVDENTVADIETRTETALQNAASMGSAGTGILAIITSIKNRINSILIKIKNRRNKRNNEEMSKNKLVKDNLDNPTQTNTEKEWIPKVETPKITLPKKPNKVIEKNSSYTDEYDATDDYDDNNDDNNDDKQEEEELDY